MRKVIPVSLLIVSLSLITGRALTARAPIVLQGLYATSIAPGYEKYGPRSLFGRGNWETMPGAAVNEGVMMYFEHPEEIASMKLVLPGGGLAGVKAVRVYADGKDLGEFLTSRPLNLKTKTSSLYVRIADVEGFDSREVPSDLKGYSKYIERFNSKKSTGFDEILLFDRSGQQLRVEAPGLVKGSVIPSSTLKPEEAYHAGYLFDSRKDSGWVEGKKGSGTGESLLFKFAYKVSISRLKIWNGLLISGVHYRANERVRDFTFSAGKSAGSKYTIPDSQSPQIVTLKRPLTDKDFRFVIKEVYSGTSYKDTVISEIMFGDGSSWFNLYSGEIDRRKAALLKRIKGTILRRVVDRYLGEKYDDGSMSTKAKSIVLRSDSSFVIWIEDEDYDGGKNIRKTRVLDGFWTINSLSAGKATVTIMGRNFNLSEQFSAYVGNKKNRAVSIFQDRLTIDKNGIRGKKFFGSIGI